MNSSLSSLTVSAIATVLALIVGASANGQDARPRRGRAIEFSEPRSEVLSSNVNLLGANKTALKDLERELKKPFELISPSDEYVDRLKTGPQSSVPRSDVKAKQMKDFLERRNDWIFLSPEEMMGAGRTAEEILETPEFGPNGEPKKRKTAIERYYERLDRVRGESQVVTNRSTEIGHEDKRTVEENEGGLSELAFRGQANPFVSAENEGMDSAKNLYPNDAPSFNSGRAEPEKSFVEIFGIGKNEATAVETGELTLRETRMQEFKQLLENRSLAMPQPSVGSPNWNAAATLAPTGFASSGLHGANSGGTQVELKPLPSGAGLQKSLLGTPTAAFSAPAPSWQITPLVPEQPSVKNSQPTFSVPKRKF